MLGWRHLCIDIQAEECDPAYQQRMMEAGIQFLPDSAETVQRFERLAGSIQDFIDRTRNFLPPIHTYNYSKPEERLAEPEFAFMYENEGRPHIVERLPADPVLLKTQQSVVPEYAGFFESLREGGTRGFVVSGVSTSSCLKSTVLDLLDRGFEVAVIPELTDDCRPEDLEPAFEEMRRASAKIVSADNIVRSHGRILEQIYSKTSNRHEQFSPFL